MFKNLIVYRLTAPWPVGLGFDADAAIATGELTRLIPELVDALGGDARGGNA